MPWTYGDPSRADVASSTPDLAGFRPLFVVPASLLPAPGEVEELSDRHPEYILVRRPARSDDPPEVDVSTCPDRAAWEAAWRFVADHLPGWTDAHRGYLTLLLVAALAARRPRATPPLVVARGLSGSGKSAAIELATGMLGYGQAAPEVALDANLERELGTALRSGAPLIRFDEAGRGGESAWAALRAILAAGDTICFTPKYEHRQSIEVRAGLVIAGSTLPAAALGPEVNRRALAVELAGVSADTRWELRVPGGSLLRARRDRDWRAKLDTITAHVWHATNWSQSLGWRELAQRLAPAGTILRVSDLGDDSGGMIGPASRPILRDLYELYRTAPGEAMSDWAMHRRQWLPAGSWTAPADHAAIHFKAGNLIEQLIGESVYDATPDDLRRIEARLSELERVDLRELLGLGQEFAPLVLKVSKKGRRLFYRVAGTGFKGAAGAAPDRSSWPAAPAPDRDEEREAIQSEGVQGRLDFAGAPF